MKLLLLFSTMASLASACPPWPAAGLWTGSEEELCVQTCGTKFYKDGVAPKDSDRLTLLSWSPAGGPVYSDGTITDADWDPRPETSTSKCSYEFECNTALHFRNFYVLGQDVLELCCDEMMPKATWCHVPAKTRFVDCELLANWYVEPVVDRGEFKVDCPINCTEGSASTVEDDLANSNECVIDGISLPRYSVYTDDVAGAYNATYKLIDGLNIPQRGCYSDLGNEAIASKPVEYVDINMEGFDPIWITQNLTTADGVSAVIVKGGNGTQDAYVYFGAGMEGKLYSPNGTHAPNGEEIESIHWCWNTPQPTQPPALPPANSNGDPHVKTWGGETFDFHGGCDLVMVHNPEFLEGKGMDIHVRTKIVTWWSYIDAAAVRIGEDVVEVQGGTAQDTWLWVNGKPIKMEKGKAQLAELGGFKVRVKQVNDKLRKTIINLGNGETIVIKSFEDIVRVDVNPVSKGHFAGSVGLMGRFPGGAKAGRNGETLFEDYNAFGLEWQVLASEPMLFHEAVGAQAPQPCVMPNTAEARRRLGESTISQEEAELACARVGDKQERANCVYDVIATGDKGMAGAY